MTKIELYLIPLDLMDPNKEEVSVVMNRFKWVDDNTIRIINREGIEKIIDIKDNYREVEYNIIPLFPMHEIKDPQADFYTNRKSLDVSDALERLKRKYQAYKSAYYLEHKTETFNLYSELFTVDYKVDNGKKMHVVDLSFTFLHWKIMEQLE